MKRTIKFRGLRVDGKGWAIGMLAYFFDNPKNAMIMPHCYFGTKDFGEEDENGNPVIESEIALGGFVNVKPETVGQYSGMKDSHGVDIFEHDLLELEYFPENRQVEFISSMFQINGIPLIKYAMSYRAVRSNIHETPAP